MIIRTLIVTAVLLIGYNFVLSRFMPATVISRSQNQGNNIKAEQYAFSDSTISKVLVGSSLSAMLPGDSLAGIYNLSFAGKTIFEGLRIIEYQKHLPKLVLIETNVLLRAKDDDFASSLGNPVLFYCRKNFPVLRDGKLPLDISAFLTQRTMNSVKTRISGPEAPSPAQNPFFEKYLQMHVTKQSVQPDAETLSNALQLLKQHVDRLENAGVKVIFFELPTHPKLCDLASPAAIREGMQNVFPPDRYHYISRFDCSEYTTTDGLHLAGESASVVAGKIGKGLEKDN